jgi:ubiquinone/menaquinone biosynthesis C-methylase UbiE
MVDLKGPGNGALLFLWHRRDNGGMSSSEATARRAAWSAYWATGGLHSCVGSFPGNYSGAIGAHWQAVFAQLRPGQRVLDLATGNGALPLLLGDQFAGGDGPQVDAVDLAEVAPAWYSADQRARIRFHSGVAMEQLPFADASFDLVVSQFGFEYAQRDAALREALRVARPSGGIAFVMHHAGSVLVQVGRAEIANLALLMAPGGLLEAAAAVIPWFARARAGAALAGNPEALRCREGYNAAMRELDAHIEASPAPDLLLEARDRVHGVLAGVGADPAPSLQLLARCRAEWEAASLRTTEMIGHALDDHQVQALLARLRDARPGASIACEPLSQREGLLGWALRLEPAAA